MNNYELSTNAFSFVVCWIGQFKPNHQGFDKLLEVSSEGQCISWGLWGRPVRNFHWPVALRAVYLGHEEANVTSKTIYVA